MKAYKKIFKDLLFVSLCLGVSGLLITSVIPTYVQVVNEQRELNQDIETASEANVDLNNSLTQSQSSKQMEQAVARQRFHMSNDDELIFVFPDNA